jgi:hypothetical protein
MNVRIEVFPNSVWAKVDVQRVRCRHLASRVLLRGLGRCDAKRTGETAAFKGQSMVM